MPKLAGDENQLPPSQAAAGSLLNSPMRGRGSRSMGCSDGAVALTFSFFLSSALLAGPGVTGPPKGPLPASPLRWAALTLGGVMAAAAEVRGMRGRAPGVGGWWPCCGETAG